MSDPRDSKPNTRPQRPKSAAQRASEANRAQQLAVHGQAPRPSDRRSPTTDDKSDAGLQNDQRPVGLHRR